MRTVFINGKFTAQRTTGVQRVAEQLVLALDALLRAQGPMGRRWVLLCPPGGRALALAQVEQRVLGPRQVPLHAWEQACLPWAARSGLLVSLAGSAPALARRQVCTFHDAAVFDRPQAYSWRFRLWYRWLFRRQARAAAALLTVSEFSLARLAYHLHCAPGRLSVIPNGGDHLDGIAPEPAVLQRLGLHGQPFLLAVGSANPSKNLALLLAAFAQLQGDAGLRLVLVGAPSPGVFAAAGASNGSARVLHAGAVSDAELKALYGHARALVFPSLYEGFGLPPLEAMACGCPVLAAHAGAVPEVCADAVLYFDPHSVDELIAALQRVLGEPGLRERLADAGRERARHWPWAQGARALAARLEPLA